MKIKPKKDEAARLLNAPVIDLVIRLDGRTNQISFAVVGGPISPEGAYAMLDGCRELIRRQELAAAAQRQNGEKETEA